jgi:hypothetical protein
MNVPSIILKLFQRKKKEKIDYVVDDVNGNGDGNCTFFSFEEQDQKHPDYVLPPHRPSSTGTPLTPDATTPQTSTTTTSTTTTTLSNDDDDNEHQHQHQHQHMERKSRRVHILRNHHYNKNGISSKMLWMNNNDAFQQEDLSSSWESFPDSKTNYFHNRRRSCHDDHHDCHDQEELLIPSTSILHDDDRTSSSCSFSSSPLQQEKEREQIAVTPKTKNTKRVQFQLRSSSGLDTRKTRKPQSSSSSQARRKRRRKQKTKRQKTQRRQQSSSSSLLGALQGLQIPNILRSALCHSTFSSSEYDGVYDV